MHRGRIVDQGRHGELLARCELYQKLSKSQLSSDTLEPRNIRQVTGPLLPVSDKSRG